MYVVRPIIACLLAVLLLCGSVIGAVARNEMAGVIDLALCGADGAASIQIDATGAPVKSNRTCPHCLAGAAAAILSAIRMPPVWTQTIFTRLRPDQVDVRVPAQGPAPSARGPPQLV